MIEPPELSPTLTTRERFAQHSADDALRRLPPADGPHRPRLRELRRRRPVPRDGERQAGRRHRRDRRQPTSPARSTARSSCGQKLAASATVRACVATQWFRYGYGRAETAADGCSMKTLNDEVRRPAATRCCDLRRRADRNRRLPLPACHHPPEVRNEAVSPEPARRSCAARGASPSACRCWRSCRRSARAQAQAAAPPKRFIVFFSPDGTHPAAWMPTGTGSTFTLSRILAPLEANKQHIVVWTASTTSRRPRASATTT